MNSRLATAVVGLVASLAISAAVHYVTGWFVFFLAVPFVPLLFRGLRGAGSDESEGPGTPPTPRTCPECGFATTDSEVRYCPRDGTELR
ncbi:hypothetical protein MBEHAL_0166 [Halarchaeum acidiphilum MH1-52-1]|uniref:Uncharacterized protein n=1 Tax=Halarchaeum acidiphilum MH1-52-1 TaxID=1261545 RepID=U2YCR7_9EURY|nr:hypothetical protein MBEHAL_0166 [Halarchaeum acidiphilum MH1-52-1]